MSEITMTHLGYSATYHWNPHHKKYFGFFLLDGKKVHFSDETLDGLELIFHDLVDSLFSETFRDWEIENAREEGEF